MRCKNYCWFGSVMLWVGMAVAQPPALDSTFVFETVYGFFYQLAPLPDGDLLVLGRFDEDDRLRWELGRMNPAHEFIWTRDVYESDSGEVQRAFVNGDRALLLTSERVYLDEHSWTYRRNYLCYTLDGDSLWANSLEDSVNFSSMVNAVGTEDGGFLVLRTRIISRQHLLPLS
ncbi:MAG: hypothetical protein IPP40_08600 [bacterium]|nr:hypothetical protein [bacterium]